MKTLEIFETSMCCPTGLCWASINTELLRISTLVNSLKEKWIIIKRHNLTNEPQDFILNKVIQDALQKDWEKILPITILDQKIVKTKEYPSNEEITNWLEIKIDENFEWWCCSGWNICDISCKPKTNWDSNCNNWNNTNCC